ncbi:MAG: hypothetical protein A3F73_13700 [Gallionellales bacterium RIFCSPLOWO2_12_FULL_59_22]|nr:MAG: hypothetical protein A3H99_02890 [Gallionellales bacterium RIFCSPLOWO2_02_FULL_59_110]OGT02083.1 MAG: hypothetical protein A2Z65_10035 [Gallionellales bacterium RIFCSPLOWO2_02_58_13]OGT10371.1 MAG: hypothetical protein A3F73_13700 [Gallionellales bacterium RIFCSPLOWO2_12_FULL_59_22]
MMEPSSENSTGQGDAPGAAPAVSLGKTLREAREQLGLSVADVAGMTKLAPRQIEALEADDLRHLPEMPFVRGFVRSYAKILQLDAPPLLAALPQTNAPPLALTPDSVEAPFPSAHSPQRQNLIWLGTALLLSVLVVAFAVWHFTTPRAKPEIAQAETPDIQPAPVIPSPPVVEEAAIAPSAAPATQSLAEAEPVQNAVSKPQDHPPSAQAASLRLVFSEESWTEIKDVDGKVLTSQVNPSGSELRLNGRAPFSLVIGHAASVRLYHRGKHVDLAPHIGPENDVARLTLE